MAEQKRKYNQQPNIITRSTDQMTVIEKRALYLVINRMETGFNVQTDLFKNAEFKITLKDLNETNYKRLKNSLLKLQSRKITMIDDFENKKFISIVPFPYVAIDKHHVTVKMMGDVIPYFLELKSGFTKYSLEAALSLTSVYSQKLYELCSRWRDKKSWNVDLGELQLLLDAENYRYQDFRRRCLDPGMAEITEKTDIKVSYTPIKSGRQVVALNFKILTEAAEAKEAYEEEMEAIQEMTPQQIAHHTRSLMDNYNFSRDQIDQIMGNNSLFYKFVELESKIHNGVIKKVKNPTAYIAKSLFEY